MRTKDKNKTKIKTNIEISGLNGSKAGRELKAFLSFSDFKRKKIYESILISDLLSILIVSESHKLRSIRNALIIFCSES
jgi:hypothetical protein